MGIDVLDESVFHKFNYQNKEAGTKLFFKHDAQCYYEFTPSTTTKVLKVFLHRNGTSIKIQFIHLWSALPVHWSRSNPMIMALQ